MLQIAWWDLLREIKNRTIRYECDKRGDIVIISKISYTIVRTSTSKQRCTEARSRHSRFSACAAGWTVTHTAFEIPTSVRNVSAKYYSVKEPQLVLSSLVPT